MAPFKASRMLWATQDSCVSAQLATLFTSTGGAGRWASPCTLLGESPAGGQPEQNVGDELYPKAWGESELEKGQS